ncbi:CbiX/SirB N-terminal domain-containing protein [Thalassolituus sp.]|uniref:sirohydrochlorin chelatase n=1 Tax=Thalassolituus sp. TaxID=2030822 RepID=UPI002A83E383|nr:CbiX/SirB N-terminal domain-containing protein [Thalassolituus sp.]
MTTPTKAVATILLAHGSSDANWLAPFDQLLAHIRSGLDSERVELAYMELAEPSLQHQVASLAAAGFTRIDILPLFFAAGRHLRKDVPAMLEQQQSELEQQGYDIEISLHSPVGLEPEVANAISNIVIRRISTQ